MDDETKAAAAEYKARIIAMTEPEFSAFIDSSRVHSHHHREKGWRANAKAEARKAKREGRDYA